jgi:transposase
METDTRSKARQPPSWRPVKAEPKPRRPRRQFTAELRADAVRLATSSQISIAHTASDLGIGDTMLLVWIAAAKTPETSLIVSKRTELVTLRPESRRLKEERQILECDGPLRSGATEVERFRFILAEEGRFSIVRMCRILDVSQSGYHGWQERGERDHNAKIACINSGQRVVDHLVEVTDMVEIGSGAQRSRKTVLMTPHLCEPVIQNADPAPFSPLSA